MELTKEFREKVRQAVVESSANYSGSNSDYSKSLGINKTVYSRMNNGETERILSDNMWLTLGRQFNVSLAENKWKAVRTSVYNKIEDDLQKCKENSMSKMLVDDCGIGKTFCAKHIARGMKDTFYIDCSQATTKSLFIRELARIVGVGTTGKYIDVLNNLKYCLNTVLIKPLIILDEAGDLDKDAFKVIKTLWNATEYSCGWYMMGAEDLETMIKKGMKSTKNSYKEIFDRYNQDFTRVIPIGKEPRTDFYKNLITTVAKPNLNNPKDINKIVRKLVASEKSLRGLVEEVKKGA